MELIETAVFTRQAAALWDDEEYRAFQRSLLERPDQGTVITGSGGLRKVRWTIPGRGKRGGARVIYYWAANDDQIFLLLAYDHREKDDLTKAEVARLRKLIEAE